MPNRYDQAQAYMQMLAMQQQMGAMPSLYAALPPAMPQPAGAFMGGFEQRYGPVFQPQYFAPPRQYWNVPQQGPLGALSAVMGLVMPFIGPSLQARGIAPLPPGFGPGYFREEQRRGTLMDIERATEKMDKDRIMNSLRRALQQAQPGADVEQVNRMAEQTTNLLQQQLASPYGPALQQALEMTGISMRPAAQLGQAAFLGAASMGVPLRAEQASNVAQALMRSYYRRTPGGGMAVNQEFARGANMQDISQMLMVLGQQGMLNPNNPQQVTRQVGELNRTLEVMRELVGDPNAGFPQMFNLMQSITGGAFGQVRAGQATRMIGQVQAVTQALSIDPAAAVRYLQASVAGAEARGFMPLVGFRAGMAGLTGELAMRRADVALGTAGTAMMGQFDPQTRIRMMRQRAEQARISQIGLGMGRLAVIRQRFGDKLQRSPLGREITNLLDRQSSGEITEAESSRLSQIADNPHLILQVAKAAGLSPIETRLIMRDVFGSMAAAEELDLFNPEAMAVMRGQVGLESMTRTVMGRMRGMHPDLRRLGEADVRQMIVEARERGGTQEGVLQGVQSVLRRRGISADRAASLALVIESSARMGGLPGYGGRQAFREWSLAAGRRTAAEQGALVRVADVTQEMRDVFRKAGVSQEWDLGQSLLNLIQSAEKGETTAQALSKAFGFGASEEQLRTLRGGMRDKLSDLRERLKKAPDQASRVRLQRELEYREQIDRYLTTMMKDVRATEEAAQAKEPPAAEEAPAAAATAAAKEVVRAGRETEMAEDKSKPADRGGQRPVVFRIAPDRGAGAPEQDTVLHGNVTGL